MKYKELCYAVKYHFDREDREILESDNADNIFPLMMQIAECWNDYAGDIYNKDDFSTIYYRRYYIAYNGSNYMLVYEYLTETYYLLKEEY